jgi:hypothetical protein
LFGCGAVTGQRHRASSATSAPLVPDTVTFASAAADVAEAANVTVALVPGGGRGSEGARHAGGRPGSPEGHAAGETADARDRDRAGAVPPCGTRRSRG